MMGYAAVHIKQIELFRFLQEKMHYDITRNMGSAVRVLERRAWNL